MPISMQLVAARSNDIKLLHIAAAAERAFAISDKQDRAIV
jgi:Asp-tRNA(Asn)/Glu-tRNA(Gln) amidotransferase A subunit family amidase